MITACIGICLQETFSLASTLFYINLFNPDPNIDYLDLKQCNSSHHNVWTILFEFYAPL